jgi:hypothetical protein
MIGFAENDLAVVNNSTTQIGHIVIFERRIGNFL